VLLLLGDDPLGDDPLDEAPLDEEPLDEEPPLSPDDPSLADPLSFLLSPALLVGDA
jgi:hypothetical protein